jgi:hypothetical protein
LAFVLPLLLGACSEVQIFPLEGTGGAPGTSAAGPTTTNGATTAPATSGVTTTGTGGEGGASSVSCPIVLDEDTYYIEHEGPGWPYFVEGCDGAPWPTAALGGGGRCGPYTVLSACESAPNVVVRFQATAFDGEPDLGSTADIDQTYEFDTLDVTFEEIGEVGQVVRGTYVGTVVGGDGTTSDVSGRFSLCRVADIPPCP